MSDLYPEKMYIELTSRCNLRCRMCVKYAAGSCITEEDLPFAIFKSLAPSLAHTHTLILNGIGEPLLHPELEEIISFARANMVPKAVIGFQSNAILLDEEKSFKLISAGLSTVCLSLDSLEENEADRAKGHSLTAVTRLSCAWRGNPGAGKLLWLDQGTFVGGHLAKSAIQVFSAGSG